MAGEVKNYTPVTDAMLRNPDPSDWLMIRHDYHATDYSPLNQITTQNVKDLQLQWVWAMNDGSNQPAPVVHNGVMYINNPGNIVQALDARKGDLIWENRIGATATGAAQRGLALYEDKVIITTSDAHIYALDARTGKNVWDTVIGDRSKNNYSTSSGPIIIKGKVVQGLGGCAKYQDEKCFISAYDAQTGKLVWKFYTIAKEGEPGGDTWGKLPSLFRAGGETWITGSYDPDLNLTYWGVAQSKPWMRASRQSGNGATLFANSTVALDGDTGKLKWYYSHAPGESLDLDEVFERVLVDEAGGQKLVFSAGKAGVLWKNDRATGKYLGTQGDGLSEYLRFVRSRDRRAALSQRHRRESVRHVGAKLPDFRRGPQLARHELSSGNQPADHSLGAELSGDAGAKGRANGRRRQRRRRESEVLRVAWVKREHRQAGGVRRQDAQGNVEDRAAGAVHDRSALNGRRDRVCWRYGPCLPGG